MHDLIKYSNGLVNKIKGMAQSFTSLGGRYHLRARLLLFSFGFKMYTVFPSKGINDWAHSGLPIYVIVVIVRLTIHKRKSKGILESLQFPLRKRKLVVSRAEF